MKTFELIEKLSEYPSELEVRVLNTAIEDDCSCPTFTVHSVSANSENNDEFNLETDVDYLVIEFTDGEYIQDEFNITM